MLSTFRGFHQATPDPSPPKKGATGEKTTQLRRVLKTSLSESSYGKSITPPLRKMSDLMPLHRRDALKLLAAIPAALVGCSSSVPIAGGFVGPNLEIGHRLRDGFRPVPSDSDWRDVDVVIVGGGIAGLAAGWQLLRSGVENFVVLELEAEAGGTSRGGRCELTAFPWGAHYLPVPAAENRSLVELLEDMQLLERVEPDGRPIVREQFLVREPEERLFVDGLWHEGLVPSEISSESDEAELTAFRAEIDRWVAWRDADGRRAFTIPLANCSTEAEATALDQISMAAWLEQHGWRSKRLKWLVDYACRDDYGSTLELTSAWAGVFYFAARMGKPGDESQPLIAFPEGNARFATHFADRVGQRLRCGIAVSEVKAADDDGQPVRVVGFDTGRNQAVGFRAKRAILAVPQFLASRLVAEFPIDRVMASKQFQYAPWLVANLHLKARPSAAGFSQMAWDNVLVESESLGYVAATHQSGRDYGPTVLTYSWPWCDADVRAARERLLKLTWAQAVEHILADLTPAHRDLRDLVERIDVMRWGHAMIRPSPGFVWSDARRQAAAPWRGLHFANTDLSGMALCEEAFFHGTRAAMEVAGKLSRG